MTDQPTPPNPDTSGTPASASTSGPTSSSSKITNFENYLDNQRSKKPNRSNPTPGQATSTQVNDVITQIAKNKGLSPVTPEDCFDIRLGVCELMQSGATSPKFDSTRPSTTNNILINLNDIRTAMKQVDPHLTTRRLARTLSGDIVRVAKIWNIPGNLSKRFLLDNPEANIDQLVWASDFQTFTDDSSIDETVKLWLLKNYGERWGKPKQQK